MQAEAWCAEHRPPPRDGEQRTDARPSSADRGYGAKWKRYSERFRKQHPWCRQCHLAGRRSPAELVDHIRPVTGPEDPMFWPPTNHQSLCRECHATKTGQEGRTQGTAQPRPAHKRWYLA